MSALVQVTIETTTGAQYTFPDVLERVMDKLLQDVEVFRPRMSSFTLANVSDACLVVPWRIIKRIAVDGKELWCNPE